MQTLPNSPPNSSQKRRAFVREKRLMTGVLSLTLFVGCVMQRGTAVDTIALAGFIANQTTCDEVTYTLGAPNDTSTRDDRSRTLAYTSTNAKIDTLSFLMPPLGTQSTTTEHLLVECDSNGIMTRYTFSTGQTTNTLLKGQR